MRRSREERDDDDDGDDDDASSTSVRASFLRAIVANESLGTRLASLARAAGTGTGTGTAGAEPRDAVDAFGVETRIVVCDRSRGRVSCRTIAHAIRRERGARSSATKTTSDFAPQGVGGSPLIALAVSGAASLLLETRLVATRGGDADEPAWLNGAAILLAVLVVVVEACA